MKNKSYIIALALSAFLLVAPSSASAAIAYFDTKHDSVAVGDTIIVELKIDSDQAAINTIEGALSLLSDGVFEVKEFGLAGSIFGLWPRGPSLSKDAKTISFVGGVPGGFNLQGARLFNIVLEAKKEGVLQLAPKDLTAYLNDGKGTKVTLASRSLSIRVEPRMEGAAVIDDWSKLITSDDAPPEEFIIMLGQEPSVFDNKRFAFFSAMDSGSGISHYEVSENGRAPIRSGSIYVLQDQDETRPALSVIAYDKSGNKKTADYKAPSYGLFGFSWTFYGVIVVLLAIWIFRRRSHAKNKK